MAGVTQNLVMKPPVLCAAFLSAFLGPAHAATITYASTALKNLQGSVAGDLSAGKLGLVILDTEGNGFTAQNQFIESADAGLDVGSNFGGDLVVARLNSQYSLGDAFMLGNWAWNPALYPGTTNKRWAIIWFEALAYSASSGNAPAGSKFGLAYGTNWITPASEPSFNLTYIYGATYPVQFTLMNGGSVPVLPPNAAFATSGTSLMVVPEAGATALSALGLLGLLRRRRPA